MRVLIVDGFGNKMEDRELYKEFRHIITESVNSTANMDIVHIDEVKVDEELSRYLFSCGGLDALQNYDRVDLVFVGLDAAALPWQRSQKRVAEFLQMCHVTKKPTFGSSAAAQFLAFLCATNGIDFTPINGEKGCPIDHLDAESCRRAVRNLNTDLFLDSTTGDLFRYNPNRNAWIPYTSIGFRNKDANYATKKYVARFSRNEIPLSKANEIHCRILTPALSHWSVKNFQEREFLVRSRPRWMLDPQTNLRSEQHYQILCESDFGPLAVVHENFFCVHFDISRKYVDTVKFVKNFCEYQLRRLEKFEHVDYDSKLYIAFMLQRNSTDSSVDNSESEIEKPSLKLKRVANQAMARVDGGDCAFNQSDPLRKSYTKASRDEWELRKNEYRPPTAYIRKSNFGTTGSNVRSDGHGTEMQLATSPLNRGKYRSIGTVLGKAPPPRDDDKYFMEEELRSTYPRNNISAIGSEISRIQKLSVVSTHNTRSYPCGKK